jgi:branched-chain amino acid transport system permease protein
MILLNQIGISIIVALGLYFLTGCCGIISLGQAGFMCLSAFTTAILCEKGGFSFWATIPCAILISGLVGVIFGLPVLRVKGFYLVIITLAAGLIIPGLFSGAILPSLNLVKPAGVFVSDPVIGNMVFYEQGEVFYVVMFFMILALLFALNLSRSRVGRIFRSIRDNDMASEISGVNLSTYRMLAFFICCLFAGLGGSMWGCWMHAVNTSQFPFDESVWYLGMIIVGGMGSIAGVVLGAIVVRGLGFLVATYLLSWLTDLGMRGTLPYTVVTHAMGITPILTGVVIILSLILAPAGVIKWWDRFKKSSQLWPFNYELY